MPRARAAPPAPHSVASNRWRAAPFVALALLASLYCGTGMVQAVDTWISLAGGRHIAAHGVGDADPFSFDSRPAAAASLPASASAWERARAFWHPSGWINQNWLTHVLLYQAEQRFGYGALAAFRFLVYLAVGALLLVACRLQGAGLAAGSVAVAAAMLAMRPFAEFRAQELTNVLAAVELIVLALAVRRSPRFLWAVVPLAAVWCNAHGGFIFGLVALGAYVVAGALPARGGGRWVVLTPAGMRLALAVVPATLAATVLASPYRLANLTHPIAITVGAEAGLWRRVNEWLPALTPGARLGEVLPFFVLVAATVIAAVVAARAPRPAGRRGALAGTPAERAPLDLGGVALAVVTVLMALRSMRFVALAALTLAPCLAAGLEGAALRARAARGRSGVLAARAARVAPWLAALVTLALAGYWGVRFQRSYLRPWPLSALPTSLFDRMTWAHRRLGVGEFLRRNRVDGRAFNVWEEGGTLAWSQEPVAAGPPLKVFIDGRAQAAYPASVVRDYIELAVGGPVGAAAAEAGRGPGPAELRSMAEWVDRRLKRDRIWIVVIPEDRTQELVVPALLARPNWRVVYLDPFHVVFADVDDSRGRRLDDGLASGETAFPDEPTRLLTRASRLVGDADAGVRRRGLEEAIRSYALRPTATALSVVLRAAADPELSAQAVAFARSVVDDCRRGRQELARQPGSLERLRAAVEAATFLAAAARREGRAVEADELAAAAAAAAQAHAAVLREVLWWG